MCEELLDDLPAPWRPRGSAVLCRNTQMLLGTGAARLENCAAPLAVCVIEKEGETRDLYGQSIVAWSQIREGSPFHSNWRERRVGYSSTEMCPKTYVSKSTITFIIKNESMTSSVGHFKCVL